ncbi:hypothetical protein FIV42_16800 [Persicimonas caeni]|uniref:Uncharacterized protein n=2 Tax=Persicimonas caeni TaxID=2292766 RepID=A0A4Y6PWF3_PERCE|nr:hypothetical protein [Persicimonas caeni]QDG52337.1 hypothetical protein FIV42_16800 [Persicimonas caeni]
MSLNQSAVSWDEWGQELSDEQKTKAIRKLAEKYYGSLSVTQDGNKLETRMKVDPSTDFYPLVYLWKATYPAGKTVHDVVTYPTSYERDAAPVGDSSTDTFTYITATGANWAKPIGEARFEYCDEPATGYAAHGESWTSYDESDPHVVHPPPRVDRARWIRGRQREGRFDAGAQEYPVHPRPGEEIEEGACEGAKEAARRESGLVGQVASYTQRLTDPRPSDASRGRRRSPAK